MMRDRAISQPTLDEFPSDENLLGLGSCRFSTRHFMNDTNIFFISHASGAIKAKTANKAESY